MLRGKLESEMDEWSGKRAGMNEIGAFFLKLRGTRVSVEFGGNRDACSIL